MVYRCRECLYKSTVKDTKTRDGMVTHQGNVHNMGPWFCSVNGCDYNSPRSGSVRDHITREQSSREPNRVGMHAQAVVQNDLNMRVRAKTEAELCLMPHTAPWTPPAGAPAPVVNPVPVAVVAPVPPPMASPVAAPPQDVIPPADTMNINDDLATGVEEEQNGDGLPDSNAARLESSLSPAPPSPPRRLSSAPVPIPGAARLILGRPLINLALRTMSIGQYYLDRFDDVSTSQQRNNHTANMYDQLRRIHDAQALFDENQLGYANLARVLQRGADYLVEALKWYEDRFGHHMGQLREDVATLQKLSVEIQKVLDDLCVAPEQDDNDEDDGDQDGDKDGDKDGHQNGNQDDQNGQDGRDGQTQTMESPHQDLNEEQAAELYA